MMFTNINRKLYLFKRIEQLTKTYEQIKPNKNTLNKQIITLQHENGFKGVETIF